MPVTAQAPAAGPDPKTVKNPVAATAQSIAAGNQLYQKLCAFCHGPKGLGDGKAIPPGVQPANLVDATWIHGSTDGEIFAVISNGAGPKLEMPGLKGRVPASDIWNLVNFIRSIAPKTAGQ
jgi:mono/diheme cytochrome c family protein